LIIQFEKMELRNAAVRILGQLSSLVETLDDKEYTASLDVLNGATIGQHVRHTLEFFICLKNGIEVGVINYDKRNHDKTIENDRFITISKIKEARNFVELEQENKPLILELSYGKTDESECQIQSNFSRELAYNIEHGVHHMAIIKIATLAVRPQLSLPEDFGVAVSTIRYQSKQENASV